MSYADNNYKQKDDLQGSVMQAFEFWKHESLNNNKWNNYISEVSGVTIKFLPDDLMELTYHKYETGDILYLQRALEENVGSKFLESVVKGLKREFKDLTGKELKLKMVKEVAPQPEKASRISAETSFISSQYTRHPVGRYLVRTSCIYEIDA